MLIQNGQKEKIQSNNTNILTCWAGEIRSSPCSRVKEMNEMLGIVIVDYNGNQQQYFAWEEDCITHHWHLLCIHIQ